MDEKSTTPADNPTNNDAAADSTTVTDPKTGTDTQPANNGDNLEDSSKSTEDSAGGDNPTDGDGNDAPASKLDDDLDDWIQKRGLKVPETDAEKQALQDLRNGQREFTREQQAKREAADAKALGDEIHSLKPEVNDDDDDDIDPLEKRQNKVEEQLAQERNTRLQSEFYTTNKVTEEEHKAILDIYKEKVSKPSTPEGKKAAFDLWSSPDALGDLLDLAKARISKNTDPSLAADEAARKERERIAKESNATSPGRGAKTSTDGKKTPEQERLARFSNWD